MNSERVTISGAKWFIVHRGTKVYCDYGWLTKPEALKEVERLNELETSAGREPKFAVSPSYRPMVVGQTD